MAFGEELQKEAGGVARREFLQQKQGFQSQLRELVINNPNAGTIAGLNNLAHTLQYELYQTSGITRGDFGRGISGAGTEFLARVPATMLDRGSISLSYERGNLAAWFRGKGLDVEVVGKDREVHWSGGSGKPESNYYFKSEELSPGALVAISEHLAVSINRKAAEYKDNPDDVRVMSIAAAIAGVLGEEIRSIAETGRPLDGETAKALLDKPLTDIGLQITERK
ncbi:hypothetical protein A3A76_05020 [Candidatus Woesebacteria bacterium RIFCSPLOWO2_01_FULL_39_23]|uniref:Uncharacterized protein n=2 Tax=Microgenomates group TaxID=1794810 RepID=A0A0H4TNP7_9BACT|nr:hypothetical protein [uncultured Microgenomates bacterium Rifle_16ft_4_minimus_37633]OGM13845.1 MAG: hypothetical protein A2141_04245 [Candidatus Woesebacteria bacterium RBG_16_40_11]OGM27795.1 MAG: hypothetical protein A2628_05240 [Candidatus Woesebacteria bacterium RIFCSPHIGHO2_01_FULL_40_22]OGM62217.1 MAG: hypothetical protein A3A76_05020 [Candidatus Woesebacteria bacterium RIFCSPLOWO2_01_FULL_39_23]